MMKKIFLMIIMVLGFVLLFWGGMGVLSGDCNFKETGEEGSKSDAIILAVFAGTAGIGYSGFEIGETDQPDG